MKTIRVLFACYALVAVTLPAQSGNAPRPDGFRGLILNETTVEDANRIFRQPASDKVDRLNVSIIDKWLDPKHKEKIFRQLAFKDIGDFNWIKLSFLDNKLVMIELDFKKYFPEQKLKSLFAVDFWPVGIANGPSSLPDKPGKYPAPFIPTFYPFSYNEVGISEKAFIWVDCSTSNTRVAGKADITRQISRILEKK